jgi:pimeloyl-ACP methyl ester carboxylesterase
MDTVTHVTERVKRNKILAFASVVRFVIDKMRKHVLQPAGLILMLSFGSAFIQAQIEPNGHWEGAATRDGDSLEVILNLRSSANGLTGIFSLPGVGVVDERLAKVQNDGPEIRVLLPERGGNASFTGVMAGDEFTGAWRYQDLTGPFHFRRTPPAPRHFREERVRFQNGAVVLAGTLLLPEGPGRRPAVVFVHGSGPARRDSSEFLAELFAQAGVAALIYDKRGVGESTGDYRKSSFDDLAADALAGVELLRGRQDINPRGIGMHGTSQGGWIAPLAASRSKAVNFLILISAPAITPAQTELQSVEANVRGRGFDERQVSAAVELTKLKIHFARSGQGWGEYATAVEQARREKWFPLAGAPLSREHWSFATWRLINDYDPTPALNTVSCPVLAIFGGRDTTFHVGENIALMQRALAPGISNPHIHEAKFKAYPKADHSILEFPDPGQSLTWPRFADGYIDFTLDWLLRHVSPGV